MNMTTIRQSQMLFLLAVFGQIVMAPQDQASFGSETVRFIPLVRRADRESSRTTDPVCSAHPHFE